jgi:hypothetical protein
MVGGDARQFSVRFFNASAPSQAARAGDRRAFRDRGVRSGLKRTVPKRKTRLTGGFLVAGEGFEPSTSGL